MTFLAILTFLHICGALMFFAAIGLEWLGLARLRSVETVELAMGTVGMLRPLGRLYPTAGAVLLLSGGYLSFAAWGWHGWIVISLVAMIVFAATGNATTGRRLANIASTTASQHGPVSDSLRRMLRDPMLLPLHLVRTAAALGIIFLMTVKPGLAGSLLTMGIALVVGLAFSLPAWTRGRAIQAPA